MKIDPEATKEHNKTSLKHTESWHLQKVVLLHTLSYEILAFISIHTPDSELGIVKTTGTKHE